MTAMRRLLPTSLRGQILLAVLLALALAQGIAAVIAVNARQEAVRAAQTGDALDRTAALVFVLERTPPDLHGNLLRAATTPGMRLVIDPAPAVTGSDPRLVRATRRLAQTLGGDPRRDIRIALGPPARLRLPPPPPRREGAHGDDGDHHDARRAERAFRDRSGRPPSESLRLSVALASGEWLNAQLRLIPPDRGLSPWSLASFGLSALAIGLALWLTLSRLLGPLRGLARAAERLGRGEEVGALPATGPSEMRALTEAFNRMQERLHRMVTDRTQMLAALGHDLRSPLTALRVRAEMVDDDETRERLLVSLAEMQDMVEQTLTYARGVWTTEDMATGEAGAFLEELAGTLEPPLSVARPAEPVMLRLRPATLRRAIVNLIENARRYGGEAEIALRATPEAAVIEIADRGPGIPPEALGRVFDPFVRIEGSRSRETGGTGLGLAIARSILKAHGGDVTLANRPGGGLVATVTLPRPAD